MAKQRGFAHSAHQNGPPGIETPGGSWAPGKLRQIGHEDMVQACEEMISGPAGTAGLVQERRNGRCR